MFNKKEVYKVQRCTIMVCKRLFFELLEISLNLSEFLIIIMMSESKVLVYFLNCYRKYSRTYDSPSMCPEPFFLCVPYL